MDTQTLTPERRQVLELYRAGKSVREIGEIAGISIQRVYQQLKMLKVPPPSQRGQQMEIPT